MFAKLDKGEYSERESSNSKWKFHMFGNDFLLFFLTSAHHWKHVVKSVKKGVNERGQKKLDITVFLYIYIRS